MQADASATSHRVFEVPNHPILVDVRSGGGPQAPASAPTVGAFGTPPLTRRNLGGYRWGEYGILRDGGLVILLKIVWAAPGGFKTTQKGGGRSPPPFWMVVKPPGV